jgi:hypothetical protein
LRRGRSYRPDRTHVRNILGPLQTSCKARRSLLSSPSTLG